MTSINIQFRVPRVTAEALHELAERDGRTVANMARVLIEQGIIRRVKRRPIAGLEPGLRSLALNQVIPRGR